MNSDSFPFDMYCGERDIKHMGYQMAFRGGLSFNLDAVIIPEEKEKLVQEGYERSDSIMEAVSYTLLDVYKRQP